MGRQCAAAEWGLEVAAAATTHTADNFMHCAIRFIIIIYYCILKLLS